MRRFLAATTLAFLSACGSSTVNPVTVPLQYKMMASPAEFPSTSCAKVSSVDVTDKRASQELGSRYLQEKASMKAQVTSSGDFGAWLRSGIEAGLKQSGVSMSAGGPVLRVSVDGIKTDESVYHRAQYSARIDMTAELVSPGGRSCWRGQTDGSSENYGYAGSAENYQETLNHAVDRAVIRLLNNADFKTAACNCS